MFTDQFICDLEERFPDVEVATVVDVFLASGGNMKDAERRLTAMSNGPPPHPSPSPPPPSSSTSSAAPLPSYRGERSTPAQPPTIAAGRASRRGGGRRGRGKVLPTHELAGWFSAYAHRHRVAPGRTVTEATVEAPLHSEYNTGSTSSHIDTTQSASVVNSGSPDSASAPVGESATASKLCGDPQNSVSDDGNQSRQNTGINYNRIPNCELRECGPTSRTKCGKCRQSTGTSTSSQRSASTPVQPHECRLSDNSITQIAISTDLAHTGTPNTGTQCTSPNTSFNLSPSPPPPQVREQSTEDILLELYSEDLGEEFIKDLSEECNHDLSTCLNIVNDLVTPVTPTTPSSADNTGTHNNKDRGHNDEVPSLRCQSTSPQLLSKSKPPRPNRGISIDPLSLQSSSFNMWHREHTVKRSVYGCRLPSNNSSANLSFTERLQCDEVAARYPFIPKSETDQYFEIMGRRIDSADELVRDCLPVAVRQRLAVEHHRKAVTIVKSDKSISQNPYSLASEISGLAKPPIDRVENWPLANIEVGRHKRSMSEDGVVDGPHLAETLHPEDLNIPFEPSLRATPHPDSTTGRRRSHPSSALPRPLPLNSAQRLAHIAKLHRQICSDKQCGQVDYMAHDLFRRNNPGSRSVNFQACERLWRAIDLHGLYCHEVQHFLDCHIEKIYKALLVTNIRELMEADIVLHVVTGVGRHSRGNVARLPAAVVEYAARRSYSWRNGPSGVILLRICCFGDV